MAEEREPDLLSEFTDEQVIGLAEKAREMFKGNGDIRLVAMSRWFEETKEKLGGVSYWGLAALGAGELVNLAARSTKSKSLGKLALGTRLVGLGITTIGVIGRDAFEYRERMSHVEIAVRKEERKQREMATTGSFLVGERIEKEII